MTTSNCFDDLPVLGKLPPSEAAAKLREINDDETAAALGAAAAETTRTYGRRGLWPFSDKPWQHTAHKEKSVIRKKVSG